MAETKERPILFSAPMVRAILDGQKTQTRRVVKPRGRCSLFAVEEDGSPMWTDSYILDPGNDEWRMRDCPYGAPGDRLWVRESHQRFDKGSCDQHVWYTAGRNDNSYVARTRPEIDQDAPWPRDAAGPAGGAVYGVPSIHMPRWASRITLEIISIRIERLNDCSNADARAEGVWQGPSGAWFTGPHGLIAYPDPVAAYAALWREINGDASWEANPFVWVVEFKRVQA